MKLEELMYLEGHQEGEGKGGNLPWAPIHAATVYILYMVAMVS